MEIQPEAGDAKDFVSQVTAVANGIIRQYEPDSLVLIKVNSWFGFKWLGFSGKAMGSIGVWKDKLTVPPFSPTRIISQHRFQSPSYQETVPGPSVHRKVSGSQALERGIAALEPGSALLWYSGNSDLTKRGSMMAYIPAQGSHECWYGTWSGQDGWNIQQTCEITRHELEFLMEAARPMAG